MGDSIITKFVEVINLLQTNINEIKQINNVIHKELPSFFTTLNRLHTTLTSLSFVYKHNSAHYDLFKHHLLKFSQMEDARETPVLEVMVASSGAVAMFWSLKDLIRKPPTTSWK